MAHISDIKLIRTDTTLDLSQKAEKGMNCLVHQASLIYTRFENELLVLYRCGTNKKTSSEILLINLFLNNWTLTVIKEQLIHSQSLSMAVS